MSERPASVASAGVQEEVRQHSTSRERRGVCGREGGSKAREMPTSSVVGFALIEAAVTCPEAKGLGREGEKGGACGL